MAHMLGGGFFFCFFLVYPDDTLHLYRCLRIPGILILILQVLKKHVLSWGPGTQSEASDVNAQEIGGERNISQVSLYLGVQISMTFGLT